jgi:hypothetical protein
MPNNSYELTIDIRLLKQSFPHLSSFCDRIKSDFYLFNGIAPVEITIPQEFLFYNRPPEKLGVTVEARKYFEQFERRQRAEGRGQKDRLVGDSNSPLIKDQQALLAGGIKPNKFEGKKGNQPSAFCLLPSAFQGFRLGQTKAVGRSTSTATIVLKPRVQLLELIIKIGQAFANRGYSYHNLYYFYRERLGVRSLLELCDEDLESLLLSLS